MKRISAISFAGLSGLITAAAISTTRYQDHLNTFLDWGITLSLLTLGFGFIYLILLPGSRERFSEIPQAVRYWAFTLIIASALSLGFTSNPILVLACLPAAYVLVSPGLPAMGELTGQGRAPRFIMAHWLGAAVSLILVGLFQFFFTSLWEAGFYILVFNVTLTLVFDIILERVTEAWRNNVGAKLVSISVITLGFLLVLLTIRLFIQFRNLFPAELFPSDTSLLAVFMCLTILSQSWAAMLLHKLDATSFRASPLAAWIKQNLPGLLLAASISFSGYLLGTALVSDGFGLIDNYFDTDSPLWINYLAADADQVVELRAVHPFVLLILRPPVWLISLLLPVDTFNAAILLNSLVGGSAAFLAWLFFKQRTGNTTYALLIAALLGFSNSHLVLSVFLESYIFSAAMLMTFVVLLQVRDGNISHLIPAGLLTFGITITNFIQTCIAFLFVRRDRKGFIRYVVIVLALAVLLSFTQNLLYPLSDPFYIPGKLASESAYQYDLFAAAPGMALERAKVLGRNILLVSLVAPDPLILREEIGCALPCFNTLLDFGDRFQIAPYTGPGSWLARFWLVLLIIASAIFAWNFVKSPRDASLQAALAFNILFNFVLHMNYGDDPMLYSPNWTYALVLFFGISFERWRDNKWLQVSLLAFVAAVLLNNIELFGKILAAISPFFQ